MSDFDRILERVRQTRSARIAENGRGSNPPASAEERIGSPFAPGARVFDRVTGESGVVIYGSRQNTVFSAPKPENS